MQNTRLLLLFTIVLLCFRLRLSSLEPYANWSYKQHLSFMKDYDNTMATSRIKQAGLDATNTIIKAIKQISGVRSSRGSSTQPPKTKDISTGWWGNWKPPATPVKKQSKTPPKTNVSTGWGNWI